MVPIITLVVRPFIGRCPQRTAAVSTDRACGRRSCRGQ